MHRNFWFRNNKVDQRWQKHKIDWSIGIKIVSTILKEICHLQLINILFCKCYLDFWQYLLRSSHNTLLTSPTLTDPFLINSDNWFKFAEQCMLASNWTYQNRQMENKNKRLQLTSSSVSSSNLATEHANFRTADTYTQETWYFHSYA